MREPSTIAVRRHRALIVVRSLALVLGVLGSIALCYVVGLMLAMQNVMAWTMMWSDTSWFAVAVGMLTPAIALFILDRRIARWLIPVPRRECHECGYPLRGLSPATVRCPECGELVATGESPRPRKETER